MRRRLMMALGLVLCACAATVDGFAQTPIGSPQRPDTAPAPPLTPDSAEAGLIDRDRAGSGPSVNRVVATLSRPLERRGDEHTLGRLIADAQRRATDAQVALVNDTSIRGGLPVGQLTWRELYDVQPLGRRLVRMQLTGSDLRNAIEQRLSGEGARLHVSGLSVWYDPEAPDGHRVLALELEDGSPVRVDGVYTVVANHFMAFRDEDGSMAAEALAFEETPVLDIDALVSYLEQLPEPIPLPAEPRFHAAVRGTSAGGVR